MNFDCLVPDDPFVNLVSFLGLDEMGLLATGLTTIYLAQLILASFKSLRPVVKRSRRIKVDPTTTPALTSADRARRRRIKEQLTTFLVFELIRRAEGVADKSVAFVLPFYDEFKTLLWLTLLVWRSTGSVLVFNNLIKPFVKPYEPLLDFIARIVGDIVTILFAIVAFGPVWIKRKWDARRAIEEVEYEPVWAQVSPALPPPRRLQKKVRIEEKGEEAPPHLSRTRPVSSNVSRSAVLAKRSGRALAKSITSVDPTSSRDLLPIPSVNMHYPPVDRFPIFNVPPAQPSVQSHDNSNGIDNAIVEDEMLQVVEEELQDIEMLLDSVDQQLEEIIIPLPATTTLAVPSTFSSTTTCFSPAPKLPGGVDFISTSLPISSSTGLSPVPTKGRLIGGGSRGGGVGGTESPRYKALSAIEDLFDQVEENDFKDSLVHRRNTGMKRVIPRAVSSVPATTTSASIMVKKKRRTEEAKLDQDTMPVENKKRRVVVKGIEPLLPVPSLRSSRSVSSIAPVGGRERLLSRSTSSLIIPESRSKPRLKRAVVEEVQEEEEEADLIVVEKILPRRGAKKVHIEEKVASSSRLPLSRSMTLSRMNEVGETRSRLPRSVSMARLKSSTAVEGLSNPQSTARRMDKGLATREATKR